MKISEYLSTLTSPIGKRTLCFIINERNEVLLGKKKRGLGEGNYLGIGGKVEGKEGIETAVIREMREEVNVLPKELEKVAIVTFLFPEKPNWNQEVHVFKTRYWDGDPKETNEITPQWFKIQDVPYDLMWDDNKLWLPKVLKGEKLRGFFLYNGLKVSEFEISPY